MARSRARRRCRPPRRRSATTTPRRCPVSSLARTTRSRRRPRTPRRSRTPRSSIRSISRSSRTRKTPRLQTELWENAAVAFTDVVKTGKVDQKLMKESAYAAVLGWKNALNVDPRVKQQAEIDDKKKYDKTPEPKPIPDREMKMLAAFDIYINYIKDPKDDELVGMKFLKANIYRRYNHFDEAIPIFQDILDHPRQHETAEYSANLLLDTYNIQQNYDAMLALADKLTGDPKFLEGKEELKATLDTLKAQAMRKP